MNRTNKMIKDVILFAIASFGPKVLSFFMVPIYTSNLSSEVFGISDVLATIVAVILPIGMLDISDAVMIFTAEAKQKQENLNVPLRYSDNILKWSSLLVLAAAILVSGVLQQRDMWVYCLYVAVCYFFNAQYLNILAYLRGIDEAPLIVRGSLIFSVVSLTSNIVLIVWLKLGIYGILLANILGYIVCNAYLSKKIGYRKLLKEGAQVSKEQKKEMLTYSIPLIFSGLAWWINSSSDRLFVTTILGASANGIYAVANKIPTILNAFHSVIYQAMQLNVFSQQKAADRESYLRRLYSIYNYGMVIVCSAIILCNKLLAGFLFQGEFYVAWKYVPALLISTVLFSTSGYVTIITTVAKETKMITLSTVAGATVNTVLNILLIGRYGLFGAVIATVIGYFVIWLTIVLRTQQKLGLRFPVKGSICCYALLLVQWMLDLSGSTAALYGAQILVFAIINIVNRDSILEIWHVVKYLIKTVVGKFSGR